MVVACMPALCGPLLADLHQRECSCAIVVRKSKRSYVIHKEVAYSLDRSPRLACACGPPSRACLPSQLSAFHDAESLQQDDPVACSSRLRLPAQISAFRDAEPSLQYDTVGSAWGESPLSFETLPGFELAAEMMQRRSLGGKASTGGRPAVGTQAHEMVDDSAPCVAPRQSSRAHLAKRADAPIIEASPESQAAALVQMVPGVSFGEAHRSLNDQV